MSATSTSGRASRSACSAWRAEGAVLTDAPRNGEIQRFDFRAQGFGRLQLLRLTGVGLRTLALDLTAISSLHFEAPDLERFPCIPLAYRALSEGGPYGKLANNSLRTTACRTGLAESNRM